ncbi:MAG TPA: hypothetical protein VKM55_26815 [Candidatus Lokiarchaeia archaeon]|nr:hypothetical protein [Candidatus Lokiarchaeia archaeon]
MSSNCHVLVLRQSGFIAIHSPSGEKYVVISNQEFLQQLSEAVIDEMLQNPGTRAVYEKSFEYYKPRFKSTATLMLRT